MPVFRARLVDGQQLHDQLAAMTTERDDLQLSQGDSAKQLATAQGERDAARSAAREIITKLEAERDQANAERQRAVDSLAKMIEQR